MSILRKCLLGGIGMFVTFAVLPVMVSESSSTQVQRRVAVPIQYRAHLPIIQVEINGKGPFDVIVDTGADVTVLDAAVVEQLSLPVEGQRLVGSPMAKEHMDMDEVRIETLRIGDAVLEDLLCVSMDLQAMFGQMEAPHAVLSAAAFDGWLMSIDFPAGHVSLREGALPAADGKQILDYTSDENVPSIPIVVGTLQLSAVMDTGAPSALSLPGAYQEKLKLQAEPKVIGMGRTVDASFEILAALLDGDLLIGEESFENPQVTFNELSPHPLLGMKLLGEYHLTIDSTNQRIEMLRGAAAAPSGPSVRRTMGAPSATKRYGIMFGGLDGDRLEVTGVEEGLIASEAGLQRGDNIVGMNGVELAALNAEQRMAHLRGSPLLLKVERNGKPLEISLSRE